MKPEEFEVGKTYQGHGITQRRVLRIYEKLTHVLVDFVLIDGGNAMGEITVPLSVFSKWAREEAK